MVAKMEPIVIATPASYPYESDKAVPWKYEAKILAPTINQPVSNIAGIGGMTRSGRCYTPEEIEERRRKAKGYVGEEIPESSRRKEAVTEEEVTELMKIIKRSEYDIVEQLNKTPARISLLALLTSSEGHRDVILKILNETYVPQDAPVERVETLVGSILASGQITFTDDEIPPEGTGHTKALHITAKCRDVIIAKVLIDNGSAINVCPKATLLKLPVDASHMRKPTMVIRAFDGTKRDVEGEIDLPVEIGPYVFDITFQVLNIEPAYSMLIGRPWIHSTGAVPSSLHQLLRYRVDDYLVTVRGEESYVVNRTTAVPFIDIDAKTPENSFNTLEVMNATYVAEGSEIKKPHFSEAAVMAAKVMIEANYQPGKGLKEYGIVEPVSIPKANERCGLGYMPTRRDKWNMISERRERRMARVEGREMEYPRMEIPPLRETFPKPAYVIQPGCEVSNEEEECFDALSMLFVEELSVCVTDAESTGSSTPAPRLAVSPLSNWEITLLPSRTNQ